MLFFDGECGLCNRLVRVLLQLDDEGRLHYAPLQGASAQGYLRSHGLPTKDFDTLIFVPEWRDRARPEYRVRTTGVIGALRAIGGGARVWGDVLALVPAPLRDLGYKGVARTRYALFGPWKPLPLPRAEWQARFLE
ncbi:MAG: DCC1-like thiol-disulfide oxidoreductase family protein [Verrucomicrobiota bacterium]